MEPPISSLEPKDRRRIEQRLRQYFAAKSEDVAAAYLFGSIARGTARRDSDVDVAVLFAEDPPRTLDGFHLDWADEIKDLLGLPVDLVVLNFASADLVHQVLKDSRLLLNHDPAKRIDFEVQARNRYFDLLPFLRRYRYPEAAT